MCSPVIVGTSLAVAGTAVKVGFDVRAANTQSKIARNNAILAGVQAGLAKQQGAEEAAMIKKTGRQVASQATVLTAGNRVETQAPLISGINATLAADIARANAARQAWGLEQSSRDLLAQASMGRQASILGSFGTVLGSAGSIIGGLSKE